MVVPALAAEFVRRQVAVILMCTNTSLTRFSYHFWMKDMIPLRYHNGNQYLHRKSPDYRNRVKRKKRAYHAFIQAGVVAQGLLQYLAVAAPKLVWSSFGSWLRTIRPDIPPSEFVVAKALARHFPNFSWILQKAIPSRNSSLSGRTCKTCQFSAWLRKQKQGLLRFFGDPYFSPQ